MINLTCFASDKSSVLMVTHPLLNLCEAKDMLLNKTVSGNRGMASNSPAKLVTVSMLRKTAERPSVLASNDKKT